jgi:hypothetical protein
MNPRASRLRFTLAVAIAAFSAFSSERAYAQSEAPTNDAPNPYRTVEGWAQLPDGRKWGSTSAVDIDRDGTSVWVAERCGRNSCLDRTTGEMLDVPTILKFDASGKLVKSSEPECSSFPTAFTWIRTTTSG